MDIEKRNKVILEHMPLIKLVANSINAKLIPKRHVKELISMGVEGLIDAIDKFDESKGEFYKYARTRINGQIIDGIRGQDWLSKHYRESNKKLGIEMAQIPYDWALDTRIEDEINQFDIVSIKEDRRRIKDLIKILNKKDRSFIDMYYYKKMSLKKISLIWGCSEAWVCKTHKKILEELRKNTKRKYFQ